MIENITDLRLWAKALSIVAIWVLASFAYLLPAFVAGWRRHRNWLPILVLNFLLGWTFLGWVLALVWALHRERAEQRR